MALLISSTVKAIGNNTLTVTTTRAFNLDRMDQLRATGTDTIFQYRETDPTILKYFTIDDTLASVQTAKQAYNRSKSYDFTVYDAKGVNTSALTLDVDNIIYMYADSTDASNKSYIVYAGENQTTTKKYRVSGALATLVTAINAINDVSIDDLTVTDLTVNGTSIHQSTDAGATGPENQTYHNSASPAALDVIGSDTFYGEDDAGNKELYVKRQAVITDPATGSEDAVYQIFTKNGGAIDTLPQVQISETAINHTRTDDGAVGATIQGTHFSTTPVANDVVAYFKGVGQDDGGNSQEYGQVAVSIVDPTDGGEIGDIQVNVPNGTGSLVQSANFSHDGSFGIVSVGDGATTGVIESAGDYDVTLRTGNSTTGNITIEDGANGDITIDCDGTGKIDLRGTELYDKARFELMEDFVMPTINETDFPVILNNDGGGGADPSIAANSAGGVLTADTTGGGGANGSQIVMSIPFSADKGGLVFETSLHINTAIAGCRVVAGITDSTAWEVPVSIAAGDTITTTASDACVFVYDDQADTDEWFAVGVAADTDATGNGTTSVAPVADTYQTLRIEVAADGATASFYIGGALVGSLTADAITAATTVYATVVIQESAAAAKTCDIDYIYVGHTR